MKIAVRDEDSGKKFGVIKVKITDHGSGLERVAVRAFGLARQPQPSGGHLPDTGEADRRHFRRSLFLRMLSAANPLPLVAIPVTQADGTRMVEIRIILPDWPRAHSLWQRFAGLPRILQATGMLAVLFLVIFIFHFTSDRHTNVTEVSWSSKSSDSSAPPLLHENPKFDAAVPAGRSINSVGGWVRISPPNRDPVYAFLDHVAGTKISVSEQPLPSSFKTNTASKVADLAKNFNATEKLTADGAEVYIGTASDGEQSLILSKKNLLILIKSAAQLSTNEWAAYISSLQ